MSELYGTLNVERITCFSKFAEVENHNRRLQAPPNADPARRDLNIDLMGQEFDHLSFQARFERLLKAKNVRPHRRGVLAAELLLSMSPGAEATVPLDRWLEAARTTAERIAPPGCIIGSNAHFDEKTPHLHVVFVPLVEVSREQRGPAPKNGVRPSKKVWALSYAEFAGHKRADAAVTFGRYHDIYAEENKDLGLRRGIRQSRAKHLPQQRLYAETEKIEAGGERLLQLLEHPEQFMASQRRPTAEEMNDDEKWSAYLTTVSGNWAKLIARAKQEVPGLLELAKGGIFAKRARETIKNVDCDRNDWMKRAHAAEKNNEVLIDAHAREIRTLSGKLLELEARPYRAEDAAKFLGLPILTGVNVAGNTVDQIVNRAGEVLVLKQSIFLRPSGEKLSVIKFLQQELGHETPQKTLDYLKHRIGVARTTATYLEMVQLADAGLSKAQRDFTPLTASALRGTLQANLEARVGVSQKTSSRLFDERILTVNSSGNGVLVPLGSRCGYVFAVESKACRLISFPPDFTPLQLGEKCTWTTVMTDDPTLALRVADAAQGLVSAQLLPVGSVTEARFRTLLREHREVLATPGVFAASWNPAQSARVRSGDECLRDVTECVRLGQGPFFSRDPEQPTDRSGGGVEFQ